MKITKKLLEQAKPNSIIHTGTGFTEHPWFNDATKTLEKDGRSTWVNFVVYRGGIVDWCIYHSLDANLEPADYLDGLTHLQASFENIAKYGAKLHNMDQAKRLVDWDDDCLLLYRH